jgi:hypothetical protein
MSIDYKTLYLKYKIKYINLKKNMYGAAAEYYFRYSPYKGLYTEIKKALYEDRFIMEIDPSDFKYALILLGVITNEDIIGHISDLDKAFNIFDIYEGTYENKNKVKIFKKICQEIEKHNAKIRQKLKKDDSKKAKHRKSEKEKELEAIISAIKTEGNKQLAELDKRHFVQGFPDVYSYGRIPLSKEYRAEYNKVYYKMEADIEQILKQIEKEKYTNEESFYTHEQYIDYNFITIAQAIVKAISNNKIINESNAFEIFKYYAVTEYINLNSPKKNVPII